MLNLLRADFYKLLRRKSFYICGILGIIVSCLAIFLENMEIIYNLQNIGMSFDSLPAMYRVYYTGVSAFTRTIATGGIFITIMVSMFVSSEFSFGTIKNIISSGKSRLKVYSSKLVMTLIITTIYTLLCGLAGFITGSIFWGTGEITRTEYLEIFRIIGLIIAVEFSMQSVFTMVGFLLRSTGAVITVNLIIETVLAGVLPLLNVLINKVFNVQDFNIMKYWPDTYLAVFNQFEIPTEQLTQGLIVCAVAFAVSTVIGMFTFQKRDIK